MFSLNALHIARRIPPCDEQNLFCDERIPLFLIFYSTSQTACPSSQPRVSRLRVSAVSHHLFWFPEYIGGIRRERRRKAAEKVACGKFLVTDRSNLQSTSVNFNKLLCKLQEQVLSPAPKNNEKLWFLVIFLFLKTGRERERRRKTA